MQIKRIIFLTILSFGWLTSTAEAQAVAIDKLTCGEFIDGVKAKNPAMLEVLIWLHGFSVGVDKTMGPFNEKFILGANMLVVEGCQQPQTPIMDAFLAGRQKILSSSAK